ncbi:MAG TPA: hypothetical protein VFZ74_07210 [Burkholderiales bacterium]
MAIFLLTLSPVPAAAQAPAQLADTPKAQRMVWRLYELLQGKQYQAAFDLILERRRAGDRWAKKALADLFVPDTPPEMAKLRDDWLREASGAGDADAQFFKGYLQAHPLLFQQESARDDAYSKRLAEALAWIEKAAAQGHEGAIEALSQLSAAALARYGITSRYFGK